MAVGMLVHEASVLVVIVNAMRLLRGESWPVQRPADQPEAPSASRVYSAATRRSTTAVTSRSRSFSEKTSGRVSCSTISQFRAR